MNTAMKTSSRRPQGRAWKLLALTSLLALVTSVAQPALAHGPMGMKGGPGMGDMGGGPGMMGGRHGERMLDGIGVTAEQKSQMRQIMDGARNDLQPLREATQALHRQLQALFAQPTVDARAVEALRQQLQAHREQSSKRMTQAMLDASRVLTPEQRKQMAERAEQRRGMMQRHRAERESLDRGAAPAPR